MSLDTTPVIIGLGELTHRPDAPPLTSVPDFIAGAIRVAAADAYGAPQPGWDTPLGADAEALLHATELIAVAPSASWPSRTRAHRSAPRWALRPPRCGRAWWAAMAASCS